MKELIKMLSIIFVIGNIYVIDGLNCFCFRNGNFDLFEKLKFEFLMLFLFNIVFLVFFYF